MRYSRSVAVSPRAIADGDPLYGEQWAWKKMEAESAWGRLREAERAQPTVAIVDTNADPDQVSYPIAGNDDAIRAIRVILQKLVDAIYTASHEVNKEETANLAAVAE